MKAVIRFSFIFAFTIINSMSFSANKKITLVSDEWCPYICDVNSAKPGLIMELGRETFKKLGYDVTLKTINWARAIINVRKGKYAVLAGAYKSDAPDFVFAETPLAISKNCFFVKKGSHWKYENINSLKTQELGVINDYSYGDNIDKFIKLNPTKIQSVSGNNALRANMKKLLIGRITVLIEDRYVFSYKAKKAGLFDNFKNVGCTAPHNVYISFSPNKASSKTLAGEFNTEFNKLQKTPFVNEVLKKYIGE